MIHRSRESEKVSERYFKAQRAERGQVEGRSLIVPRDEKKGKE